MTSEAAEAPGPAEAAPAPAAEAAPAPAVEATAPPAVVAGRPPTPVMAVPAEPVPVPPGPNRPNPWACADPGPTPTPAATRNAPARATFFNAAFIALVLPFECWRAPRTARGGTASSPPTGSDRGGSPGASRGENGARGTFFSEKCSDRTNPRIRSNNPRNPTAAHHVGAILANISTGVHSQRRSGRRRSGGASAPIVRGRSLPAVRRDGDADPFHIVWKIDGSGPFSRMESESHRGVPCARTGSS
jgi:hypothetical protein